MRKPIVILIIFAVALAGYLFFKNNIIVILIIFAVALAGYLFFKNNIIVFGETIQTIPKNYWNRAGAVLSPKTTGDSVNLGAGSITAANLSGNNTGDQDLSGLVPHARAVLLAPFQIYLVDPEIVLIVKTDAAITITNIEVSCNVDPTTEPSLGLYYADAFIGLANPVLIQNCSTTNGVFSSGAISKSVPSGKCVYIKLEDQPLQTLTQIAFNVTYNY